MVPWDETTVSTASYVLRKSGMTHEMTFRELFERILGQGEWQPLIDANERYYMFGGKVPSSLLEALPWPSDLEFVGSSPYVASEGVTAKAHYDHWYAFLVQLHGTKAVKMVPPWDYSFIYPQHEKTADKARGALVDLNNPDFDQFPLLNQLHGEIAVMNAGDVLYMPVDWWHEVETEGFSVSINRRLSRSALDWAGALLVFGYQVLQGAYLTASNRSPPTKLRPWPSMPMLSGRATPAKRNTINGAHSWRSWGGTKQRRCGSPKISESSWRGVFRPSKT